MNLPCHDQSFRRFRWGPVLAISLLLGLMGVPSPAAAQNGLVTAAEIKRISPQARDELAAQLATMQRQFAEAGVDNPLVMAHFIAQVMTETGGLRRLDENLNYSYEVALKVFSRSLLPEPKARQLARQPREFANWVYGHRLGNRGRDTDDGWTYRGSGYIQLTGRGNFRARGGEIGMPLETQPDLAREPEAGLKAALAYWKAVKVSRAANDNDAKRVRILVNGPAAHGFSESKIWFNKAWVKVFRAKAPPEEAGEVVVGVADDPRALEGLLVENGFLSEGFESGPDATTVRTDAIKDFQRSVGLPETGAIDENTEYELLDAWRHRYPDGPPPVPESQGDQTMAFDLTEVASANESTSVPTEAEQGSGQVVDNVNIPQEDLDALARARGSYADYEMGRAAAEPERYLPYSVIGDDTRQVVNDTTAFPARAIVQILFEDRGGRQYLCSGTMVSPDTVLTAAHCIHSGTTSGQPYRNFRVTPGRNVGAAPFGRCKARMGYTLSGWTAAESADASRSFDLGALKLDCDVGQRTGWVGMRAFTDNEPSKAMAVQGYAADKAPPGLQLMSTGTLTDLQTFKGFYDNDTFGGTSGAGVFVVGAPDQLVGVHTNGIFGSDPPWSTFNAFTRLTPERLTRVQEWIGP